MMRVNVSYFALIASIVSFLQFSASSAQYQPSGTRPPSCHPGLVIDCSIAIEDIVWATENYTTCNISVNRCLFNTQNCYRFRNRQSLLKEISKEACQKLCNNSCQLGGERVCAKRGNNLCYFPDKCALERHVCNNAEIWRQELNRFCDESASISSCPTV